MKKWISLLLALILLLIQAAALAETAAEELPEPEATEEPVSYDYTELVVGNPTRMDGKFFTGMWGNATSDIDVRTLVNSYYLTVWAYETGIFRSNRQTVRKIMTLEDQDGNREYVVFLQEDLKYSDGTPITAWDYAFSVLFQGAPEIAELDGIPMDLSYLKGYEEYYRGEVPYLSGVRVQNDYVIRFTVRHETLPYFFELFRLGFLPYPIHEIAPGCKVYDDGDGVYIGNEDQNITERIFTAELLRSTVIDPEEGYLSHPTVGSGPYVLTSWDGTDATFEINPYFKGDEEGNKPTIPYLRYHLAKNETMIEELQEGKFGLLNKVTRADAIEKGLELSGGQFKYQNYPRIGQTFIVFTPDRIAVQGKAVRKAIAYSLEKDEVVRKYCDRYGTPMDGWMGLGQWMYELLTGTIKAKVRMSDPPTEEEQEKAKKIQRELNALSLSGLKHYDQNTEEAIRLLEEDGWVLNREGNPYDREKDDVRCKEIDGQLVSLDLTCAYPETNVTAEYMEDLFLPHLEEAGIRVTLIPADMKTLLRSYNERDYEDVDMFYLGDDFNIEYDPQLFFLPGDWETAEEDSLTWVHAWMYELADRMCRTQPADTLGFLKKWLFFQENLSDYLPLIPVYSNIYFDFYTRELQNYDILRYVTWGDAIVPSTFRDYADDAMGQYGVFGDE